MRKHILISALLLLLLVNLNSAKAQGSVDHWQQYNVILTIQENSGLNVEEIHEVALFQGATTYQKIIAADKLSEVQNIKILGLTPNGSLRSYEQADTQAEYTFQVNQTYNQYVIQLYFPPNNMAVNKFTFRYFVIGGLQFYDEADQFDWRPFGPSASAPIKKLTTIINFPGDVPQEQFNQNSVGIATANSITEPGQTTFMASNITTGDKLEVSLTYPHGLIQGSPPYWQQIQDISFILQWLSVILGLLILIGGLIGVYSWWYLKLRVAAKSAKKIPKYINRPPSRLTPAIAGALLDGKANPRHISATLLDLAAKGALNVYGTYNLDQDAEENSNQATPDFDLYSVDQKKAVEPYEALLYVKTFGHMVVRKRNLSKVRNTLYMSTPELKTQIDLEITKAGYFIENTQGFRRQYMAFGAAGILMSIVLAFPLFLLLSNLTTLIICPFLSLIIGSLAFIGAGFAKSKKTQVGANETAKWKAFKRYIKDMNKKRATKARPHFARLLPYAVAFGLEKQLIKSFAEADTPMPKWWTIPEEKLPDVDHEKAHAWLSESIMQQPKPEPQPKKEQKPTSIIRRLGTAGEDDELLKDNQALFMTFLKDGYEAFARFPSATPTEKASDPLAPDPLAGESQE